nr:MAG TPA: hypothetical protein [Caudoviricetes sp.]
MILQIVKMDTILINRRLLLENIYLKKLNRKYDKKLLDANGLKKCVKSGYVLTSEEKNQNSQKL